MLKFVSRAVTYDVILRFVAALAMFSFICRIGRAYFENPASICTLFLLISEIFTLGILILARKPNVKDYNGFYMIIAVTATFIVPLLIQAPQGKSVIPEMVTTIISFMGILWVIYAKYSLGRSFGILAANRNVKASGAYRFMRHPIYFGYFWIHVAFLLDHFVVSNIMVLVVLYLMQSVRALREEHILSADPAYRAYCEKTPYRFLYGVI